MIMAVVTRRDVMSWWEMWILLFAMAFAPVSVGAAPLPAGFCLDEMAGLWTCTTGDGLPCDEALTDLSSYRQILTVPTGYESQIDFEMQADLLRTDMSNPIVAAWPGVAPTPDPTREPEWWEDPRWYEDRENHVWSVLQRERLLYLTYWVEGAPLGDPDNPAAFNARLKANFLRPGDQFLRYDIELVESLTSELQAACTGLDPLAVVTLFEVSGFIGGKSPNATLPGRSGRPYGMIGFANSVLDNQSGYLDGQLGYLGAHEVGHAAMNWGDEYLEGALKNTHVKDIDIFTPFLIWGQGPDVLLSILGVYPMRMSEILYANGQDNVSVTEYPARVSSGSALVGSEEFLHEGAYFGGGLYRYEQEGVMGHDYFALNLTPPQTRLMNTAFGTGPVRANDRLVNAGPPSGFGLHHGSPLKLMLFDEDKNHQFHPTQSYDVQVEWTEAYWNVCQMTGWPFWYYYCIETESKSFEKTFTATRNKVNMDDSDLWSLGVWVVDLLCWSSGSFDLFGVNVCDTGGLNGAGEALGAGRDIYLPYQELYVPTPTPRQNYYWRFRSNNGTETSGWTGWSRVYRGG